MEVPSGEKIIQKIFGKLNYIEKNNRRNLKAIKGVYKKQSTGGFNIDQNVAKMNWELTKIEKRYKNNPIVSPRTKLARYHVQTKWFFGVPHASGRPFGIWGGGRCI